MKTLIKKLYAKLYIMSRRPPVFIRTGARREFRARALSGFTPLEAERPATYRRNEYSTSSTNLANAGSNAPRLLLTGFTLVETLVAVAVLTAAIAGPMTLVQKSLSSARYAKDQTIANYLAGEAIEYVRSLRDENIYKGSSYWLSGLGECKDQVCGIDLGASSGQEMRRCNVIDDCVLYFRNSGSGKGVYGHSHGSDSGWIASPFKRKVRIIEVDNGIPGANFEALIQVTVDWQTGSYPPRQITLETRIFNWPR